MKILSKIAHLLMENGRFVKKKAKNLSNLQRKW